MKRWSYFFLAVVLLLFVLFVSEPQPARASSTLSPGFYDGWVHYLARGDFHGQLVNQGGKTYITWGDEFEGRGHLMVKINDAGAGGASIVLPTVISLMWIDEVDVDNVGSCTGYISTWASSNYVHLRGAPTAMGDTFQVPFKPAAALILTDQAHKSSLTGPENGCEAFTVSQLPQMLPNEKPILAQISAIQFQTTYHSDTQMGGTCSLPGWVRTIPSPPFKELVVYSLPKCFWRVVKSGPSKPQKGWK